MTEVIHDGYTLIDQLEKVVRSLADGLIAAFDKGLDEAGKFRRLDQCFYIFWALDIAA